MIQQRRARRLQRLKSSLPVALAGRFVELDILTHAASLAFYALLSLAPLLVLLLWLTASMYGSTQDALVEQIGSIAGPDAASVADTVINNADSRPSVGSIAGAWSTFLLLVGASAVFARLQDALNLIFRADAAKLSGIRQWIRKRVLSFGVVLSIGFLLLLATTTTTLLQVVFAGIPSLLPALGYTASVALYVFAFAMLYHFLPDRRVRWRLALAGGAFTAVLFTVGRLGITWYLDTATTANAYGAMGALVLAMLWVYYASIILFVGAVVTATVDERMGRVSAP